MSAGISTLSTEDLDIETGAGGIDVTDVWPKPKVEREPDLLSRSPQEVLESLETPQDCLEFISSILLVEYKKLVDKEIHQSGEDYRLAGFYLGGDPEYPRFFREYFTPTIGKLGSFELDSGEQEKVMQSLVSMYSKFTSRDTYSEPIFLFFSEYILRSHGVQAFPHINAMYDRYFEEVSSDLIQREREYETYLKSGPDGINTMAGYLPGRLALLLAGDVKKGIIPPNETIEFSIGFIDRYPYGSLISFSEAMEIVGTGNSVPILLKHLSDNNEHVRSFVAETLFRLELGEREVTDGEFEVFGKVFKLTSQKGQQRIIESLQAARRLDPHGRWAVFDENGDAKGLFTIESEELIRHNHLNPGLF